MRTAASWLAAALLAAACAAAHAQQQALPPDEERDFGVAPTAELRLVDVTAPTPRAIPGATTIATGRLLELLAEGAGAPPLLLDVIGDAGHPSLPGAIWLPGAGRGTSFDDALQAHLAKALEQLTGGDRSRALVFLCAGVNCWLSYNAALRAVRLGYGGVHWYRGGLEAWLAAGGRLVPMQMAWKRPE
jgi:PQQ-dependent catabolism-associated CXXCW motif protein